MTRITPAGQPDRHGRVLGLRAGVGAVTRFYLCSLVPMVPAILLGRVVNHRLRGNAFLKVVYGGLVAISATLMAQAMK